MLAKDFTLNMKMPKKLKGKEPPVGWFMSEKLDGYRARFNPDTKTFVSRQNKPYYAPDWFTNYIGNYHLDGELFTSRNDFESMGIVRKKIPVDEEWAKIKFYVYDAPEFKGTFRERMDYLKSINQTIQSEWEAQLIDLDCPIVLLDQHEIQSLDHMKTYYNEIIDKKGEGIILKHPDSEYTGKRSDFMLKYKPCYDAEAIIVDYTQGTGKYSSMLGAFVCRPLLNTGKSFIVDQNPTLQFSISGMDDEVRES